MTGFRRITLAVLMAAGMAALGTSASAQEASQPPGATGVTPKAQAVLDRMTGFLQAQRTFSIDAQSTRDEVVAFGYKLQNNEHSLLTVQRPDKLRVELSGDIRNRTFVYDGKRLTMYSPDDSVYTHVAAPDNLGKLISGLLDAGVELPLIDVLYQGTTGTLAEGVRSGVLVGTSKVDGVACDHLAFRQVNADWQLWVEQGERPLPRKIVITTRYEYGDPQYEATLDWNLKPKIGATTFAFAPPKGANEVDFVQSAVLAEAAN